MTHTNTIGQIRKQKTAFLRMRNDRDLAKCLGVSAYKLQLMSIQPKYHLFSVPKRSGGKRWIEDPERELKSVQRSLNDFLQSVYFFRRSRAAYGFLACPKRDPEPRNILTNAKRHMGAGWLWNGDLKDFFHQVKWERVFQIFVNAPFGFDEQLAELLAKLTCHQGRLPMGAPTSPILSNFATLELDEQLGNLADWAGWTYTRFADDLSFSNQQLVKTEEVQKIKDIVVDNGFEFNASKFRAFGPGEEKEVTGLIVKADRVEVPRQFLEELENDLTKLDAVLEVQYRSGQDALWADKFRQELEGKVNFVNHILGEEAAIAKKMNVLFEKALHIPEHIEPIGWLNFNYF